MLYAVTIERGWLQLVNAPDQREAERIAKRAWNRMYGQNVYPDVHARPATDDDIAWHRAMGGNRGDR